MHVIYCLKLLGSHIRVQIFDGHGGKGAAHFVRDNLPRVIVEDAEFPLELGKAVTRSFMQTDIQFAKTCAVQSTLSSGTTALTAMIFGRLVSSLLKLNILFFVAIFIRSNSLKLI